MIRTLLLSTAISLVAIGGAFAADLPNTKGEPVYAPPPPPPPTWTGFYIGVNGGYGGDRFVYPLDGALTYEGVTELGGNGNANITSSGFLAGGQIGYNYQFQNSNFVLGGEADIDWTSIRGQLGASVTANAANGDSLTASGYAGSHLEYLGTARVRLGYAFGNLLPYITGGFAYGQTSANPTLPKIRKRLKTRIRRVSIETSVISAFWAPDPMFPRNMLAAQRPMTTTSPWLQNS